MQPDLLHHSSVKGRCGVMPGLLVDVIVDLQVRSVDGSEMNATRKGLPNVVLPSVRTDTRGRGERTSVLLHGADLNAARERLLDGTTVGNLLEARALLWRQR